MGEKDLVHIVKVSDDTFARPEIIPVSGIMLCILSLISCVQSQCELCVKNISIVIIIYLTNFVSGLQPEDYYSSNLGVFFQGIVYQILSQKI